MSETTTLAQCPIGLFLHEGELCLKTEYGNNEGRIDAYIVSTGEFFWGHAPQTIANQREQIVTPVDAHIFSASKGLLDALEGMLRMARAAGLSDRIICHEAREAVSRARGL